MCDLILVLDDGTNKELNIVLLLIPNAKSCIVIIELNSTIILFLLFDLLLLYSILSLKEDKCFSILIL